MTHNYVDKLIIYAARGCLSGLFASLVSYFASLSASLGVKVCIVATIKKYPSKHFSF